MAKRFVIDNNEITINGNSIEINGKSVNHINVLRHKVNDEIEINDYLIKLLSISKDNLVGEILGRVDKRGEPNVQITLYQGYLKSDKMDTVVQKAVELGAKYIVPIMTKNTVVKLEDKDKVKKVDRLNKICIEAVQQCGRTDDVYVQSVENIKDILEHLKQNDVNILAYENSNNGLRDCINSVKIAYEKSNKNISNIGVIIGPEGGFDRQEIEHLTNNINNVYEVSLGERILRSETASSYILSIIGYEFE